jgi:hypothetical protein
LGARESRSRGALSVALVVLASLMALGGGLTLYVREELVDSSAFAERAVDAVHEPTLQRVVAREIAVQVLEPAVPDLVAGRPFVQEAVRFVIGSEPFGNVIRTAALHGQCDRPGATHARTLDRRRDPEARRDRLAHDSETELRCAHAAHR